MTRLAGRTALVTGGLRGIGRGIAERFAAEGARVMIADLEAAAHDLPAGDCLYQRLDVTSERDWGEALDTLERRFGMIDILVNNAGTSRAGSIATATEADWRFVFDTNALSVFLGCQHALRRMGQRPGAIVNIASARGLRPGSGQCAYAASKAAVLSMTQSIALHCGETGLRVRCNAIAPGVIDTPLMRRHAEENGGDATVAAMAAAQITGERGTPDDVAQAAVFLASDDARFITGTILRVDGGFVIRDK